MDPGCDRGRFFPRSAITRTRSRRPARIATSSCSRGTAHRLRFRITPSAVTASLAPCISSRSIRKRRLVHSRAGRRSRVAGRQSRRDCAALEGRLLPQAAVQRGTASRVRPHCSRRLRANLRGARGASRNLGARARLRRADLARLHAGRSGRHVCGHGRRRSAAVPLRRRPMDCVLRVSGITTSGASSAAASCRWRL